MQNLGVCLGVLALMNAACTSLPANKASLPDGFVRLSDVAPTIAQDMRYARSDNFVGRRVEGYEAGECILARRAAEALREVQASLVTEGLSLIVFDCYRPQRAVDDFVVWSEATEEKTKAAYYPNLQKSDLFPKGYIARKSGHSRGSTVDLGLMVVGDEAPEKLAGDVPCTEATGDNAPSYYLDFGTAFDCFDTLSNTADPRIDGRARDNRALLVERMATKGFGNYPLEWWHFTYRPEAFPDRYFDFPVN
ncbi:MAG: M15 family metallopeptidase [Pseudomonadota bacterium]